MINLKKLLSSILICQLAGFIGSLATTPAIPTWYAKLNKPSFNPPNSIFAPVWTSLFLLMGISLYLVWDKSKKAVKLFGLQLGLNVFWSFLFFGFKSPLWAFLEILVLWSTILLIIISFYKISKWAGILLLPYLAWVSFAAILNFAIFSLN